jgi:hypothetical protein
MEIGNGPSVLAVAVQARTNGVLGFPDIRGPTMTQWPGKMRVEGHDSGAQDKRTAAGWREFNYCDYTRAAGKGAQRQPRRLSLASRAAAGIVTYHDNPD